MVELTFSNQLIDTLYEIKTCRVWRVHIDPYVQITGSEIRMVKQLVLVQIVER